MLLPQQIIDLTEKAIEKCPIKNVSKKFLEQLKEFLEGLASEISRVRMNIGLKDGLSFTLTDQEHNQERKDKVV